jgi:hypothetical protein
MSLSFEKNFTHAAFIQMVNKVDDPQELRQIAIELHHLYLAQQQAVAMLKDWK